MVSSRVNHHQLLSVFECDHLECGFRESSFHHAAFRSLLNMPRKSRAKTKTPDDEDSVKAEIQCEDDIKKEEILPPPPMVSIPFLTDKPVTEEEIPTYVVDISKSARAIW